jgi:hypothetical protein
MHCQRRMRRKAVWTEPLGNKMKFIVYVSQAVKPFTSDQLGALLAHSRTRNEADVITGALVYRYNEDFDRGNFLQILEGPDAALEAVWKRISNDSRHHTIVVVEEGSLTTRMFADWSMGFKNISADALADYPGFADMGSDAFWETAKVSTLTEALDILTNFYDAA